MNKYIICRNSRASYRVILFLVLKIFLYVSTLFLIVRQSVLTSYFFHKAKLINHGFLSNDTLQRKKKYKKRHSVFNLTKREECGVIAFRFDNHRIAYRALLFPGRSARLSSAIFVKKKKKLQGTEPSWHIYRFILHVSTISVTWDTCAS